MQHHLQVWRPWALGLWLCWRNPYLGPLIKVGPWIFSFIPPGHSKLGCSSSLTTAHSLHHACPFRYSTFSPWYSPPWLPLPPITTTNTELWYYLPGTLLSLYPPKQSYEVGSIFVPILQIKKQTCSCQGSLPK